MIRPISARMWEGLGGFFYSGHHHAVMLSYGWSNVGISSTPHENSTYAELRIGQFVGPLLYWSITFRSIITESFFIRWSALASVSLIRIWSIWVFVWLIQCCFFLTSIVRRSKLYHSNSAPVLWGCRKCRLWTKYYIEPNQLSLLWCEPTIMRTHFRPFHTLYQFVWKVYSAHLRKHAVPKHIKSINLQ